MLVLDVDDTILLPPCVNCGNVWEQLAKKLGGNCLKEEFASREKWLKGDYKSALEWLLASFEYHKREGLSYDIFASVLDAQKYRRGFLQAMGSIDVDAFCPVIISGGFRRASRRIQVDTGIRLAFSACEYFFDSVGKLISFGYIPCDGDGKVLLINWLKQALKFENYVYVGDGNGDEEVMREASLSIYMGEEECSIAKIKLDDFINLPQILADWQNSRR